MPIFEVNHTDLVVVPTATFVMLGIKERGDLQRLLAARIEALESGLMVLTDEFSGWSDSTRRIDLLCLDTKANLVVIELKRDESGGHLELQALRYAAMVSAMTFDQAVAVLARFRGKNTPDEVAARASILSHVGWSEPDEDLFAQETRIILVSADFGKEVTTTVLWLRNSFGMDIRCVRLRPHKMSDGRVLLDIQSLIPLPEESEFQTQLGAKHAAERKERAERHEFRYNFWKCLLEKAKSLTNLHSGRSPTDDSWISGGVGRTGFNLNYVIRQRDGQVELKIDSTATLGAPTFATLKSARDAIEKEFGSPLIWEEPPEIGGWRICHRTTGGYRDPESEWPKIQDGMIDSMIRLDHAIRPRIAKFASV
jgi:hypothetical protein